MKSRFYGAVSSVVHACSDFGGYFMNLQSRCFQSGRRVNCEDTPHIEEAKLSYRASLSNKKPPPLAFM